MARRLTTIVITDVVGYSRSMAADETGTLAAVKAHQEQIINPLLESCGGRIVKLMGDGSMLEFTSVVDSVRFAVLMQRAITEHSQKLVYRIGINIGDVIADGDDLFGDGVNIAARLEPLADPGGVCISQSARRQILGKLNLDLEAMGAHAVKNIPEPVEVWRVVMNDKATLIEQPDAEKIAPALKRSRLIAAIVVGALLAVIIGGYIWLTKSIQQHATIGAEPDIAQSSLIVLPFNDLSNDGSLGHFADGMTEDLITDLARWREIRVTARNSSNLYKGKSLDVRQVAKEMGTRYVLEGSVRRANRQMRITAQLIDGHSGEHVWAERFEEVSGDIIALQDLIITKIVQSLIGNRGVIRNDEYAKTWARADVELEEYDYYLRGHDLFYRFNPEDNARAIAIWEQGLTKYPNSGLLKIKLSVGHYIRVEMGYSTDKQADIDTASAYLDAGMADTGLPPAGYRFGRWLDRDLSVYKADYDNAIRKAQKVVETYPNDTEGLMISAKAVAFAGRLDLAHTWLSRALMLGADSRLYGAIIGMIRYAHGDYTEAAEAWESWFNTPERSWYLAACYAELGMPVKAEKYVIKLRKEFPRTTPETIRTRRPWRESDISERLLAQLAKAGWPG